MSFSIQVRFQRANQRAMTFEDFLFRFENFAACMGSLIVFGVATKFYLRRARRSVLLIAISAAIGAMLAIVGWVSETSSTAFWNFISFCYIVDMTLWSIGCCLLLREVEKHEATGGD